MPRSGVWRDKYLSMSQLKASRSDFHPESLFMVMPAETVYEKCTQFARNLWWSWHPEVITLFRDLDPIRWRQLDHNPIALLKEFTPERLEARASELVLYSRINYAYRRLKEYLVGKQTWGATHAGVLGARPVAYFSAEFGIHESVPVSWAVWVSCQATISRVPAAWASRWWRSGCSTTKVISATPEHGRLSSRGISGYARRELADGARLESRRAADHHQH